MTNVTLSIKDETYRKMKKFSEIKWSEFIRKVVDRKVEELEKIEKRNNESLLTMLASEEVLKKDWLTKEEDEVWKDL